MSRLIDIDDSRNCYIGMDGEYEKWNIDPGVIAEAQPQRKTDEWCTDCKEYDQERHCCPRWNRVIRETLKDAQPETHEKRTETHACDLPSAEPIIRCKDCKHKAIENDVWTCPFGLPGGPEFFCGYGAETEVEHE